MPTRAEDGAFRCLPLSTGGKVRFLDASCTVPVIAVGLGQVPGCHEPAPDYVTYAATVSCPEPRSLVASRGEPIESPSVVYESRAYGNCQAAGTVWDQFYSAVPSPPGDWVSLTREVLQETSGLGVELWRSEDGLRALGTLRILPEDAECGPATAEWIPPPPYEPASLARCTPPHALPIYSVFTTTPNCGFEEGDEVISVPRCAPEAFARLSTGGGHACRGPRRD